MDETKQIRDLDRKLRNKNNYADVMFRISCCKERDVTGFLERLSKEYNCSKDHLLFLGEKYTNIDKNRERNQEILDTIMKNIPTNPKMLAFSRLNFDGDNFGENALAKKHEEILQLEPNYTGSLTGIEQTFWSVCYCLYYLKAAIDEYRIKTDDQVPEIFPERKVFSINENEVSLQTFPLQLQRMAELVYQIFQVLNYAYTLDELRGIFNNKKNDNADYKSIALSKIIELVCQNYPHPSQFMILIEPLITFQKNK